PVRRGPRDPPSGGGCHRKSRCRPCGQRLLRRAGEVALAPACRGPSLHGTGLSQPQGEGTLRCFRSGEASGGHSGGPILAASTHGRCSHTRAFREEETSLCCCSGVGRHVLAGSCCGRPRITRRRGLGGPGVHPRGFSKLQHFGPRSRGKDRQPPGRRYLCGALESVLLARPSSSREPSGSALRNAGGQIAGCSLRGCKGLGKSWRCRRHLCLRCAVLTGSCGTVG
ncbi:unnamed protein product, partial [Symbiodinium microadriaticum]